MNKTKQFSRLLCILLAMATIVGGLISLASCKKDRGTNETQPVDTSDTKEIDSNSEEARYRPEEVDFDGYEYKLLVDTNTFGQAYYVYESDDTPREVCDYAIWCRQNMLAEKHGINISIRVAGTNVLSELSVAITAGVSDFCQGATLSPKDLAAAASSGYLRDLNTYDELNLDASYWDQRIQEEFNINGHLFGLTGEYSVQDDLVTMVVIYNDTAYSKYEYYEKYGSPYQLSAEGKWTYEMMMSMIKETSHKVNGDNVMDESDFWGFVTETPAPYYFFLGSGQKYILNNSGTLSFAAQDDTAWQTNYNILEDMMKMCTNEDVFVANRDAVGKGDVWSIASQIFSTNRALFRSTALSATLRLLDMQDDYGIMPIPKYYEGQADYYCQCSSPAFVIPTCVSDPHKSALAIEFISYYSLYMGGDSLNYAFYDLLAFARLCRSQDDVNMLKLVFANKTYDIDFAAGFTKIRDEIHTMALENEYSALYSTIAAVKTSANTKIQDFIVNVESNLKKD